MNEYLVPTIGSTGYYEFSPPFSGIVAPGERLTCQAIRSISDYLASDEDPKTLIYEKYSLSDSSYESDTKENSLIVHLQSDVGHWYYIPASYIASFPKVDGIPYRSMMISISLPAIPLGKDLSNLEDDLKQHTMANIGVMPATKIIETSRVVMVSEQIHNASVAARRLNITAGVSLRSQLSEKNQQLQAALDKIQELENFIKGIAL